MFFLFNQERSTPSQRQAHFNPPSLQKDPFHTMPPKKTVSADAGKNPAPAKRQRTLTNKQQQLGKISYKFESATNCGLLVAQRDEKENLAKHRALTDAVRSEQYQEEINGFHKRKIPGNVYPLPVFLHSNSLLKYQTMMAWGLSRKTMMMNCTQ